LNSLSVMRLGTAFFSSFYLLRPVGEFDVTASVQLMLI
jgi:hypothetical protein